MPASLLNLCKHIRCVTGERSFYYAATPKNRHMIYVVS